MATRLIAVALLALTLLPVAALLPGGEVDPGYGERMLDWLNGLALCLGAGVLAAYIAKVRDPARPWSAPIPPYASGTEARRDGISNVVIGVGALVLYAVTARWVLSGRPLLIDEIVQVMQARWFVDGRLWVDPSPLREFFSIMHVVDLDDKVYSQFPAGGPAMLALGSLVGAEWMVGPVAGAVSVMAFGALMPALEPRWPTSWHRGATLLFALAPFGVFMFASHMNHATTLMWLLLAAVSLARSTATPAGSVVWGFLAGTSLGMAATIRPLDAIAFALPAAAWLGWRARLGRGPSFTLLASGAGIAIPLALLLTVNAATTGAPLLFGYDVLWGSGHSIGFHASPWGPPHTPARGLELVSISLARLSSHLFDGPFPAILLIAGGLWTARRLSPLDRYLLASGGLLMVGYWAYWHDGYFLGPRFYFPLLPLGVLWSARCMAAVHARCGPRSLGAVAVRAFAVAALALTVLSLTFVRVPSYRNGMTSLRLDVAQASERAGVRDALVLVKESWGARLVVRIWALGVSRSVTERIYRNSDVCRLELTVTALEERRRALSAGEAERTLLPLMADSAQLVRTSSGFTESVMPGFPYPPVCTANAAMDEEGQSHLAPFLLARDGNVYARWLPGREAEIAALYPGRPVYRLARLGSAVDAPVVFQPLRIDPR